MILVIYTVFGIYLIFASRDPVKYKSLLGNGMWGMNLAHGIVAFAHVFADNDYREAISGYTSDHYILGGCDKFSSTRGALGGSCGNANYAKLLACALWFGTFAVNFGFIKANAESFGSLLLPWDMIRNGDENSEEPKPQEWSRNMRYYSYWLFF
eukprot:TRINITY_DN38816_c0_g1_i1.p1 TRINITY_DN38816_c0_g1~~TRINITY_DN38816_c0_g1_i1.p1  ORF type:complete len:154 (-),score=22.26 TRINITY_DN38816_c0_g1_i1:98-559(-)